MLDLNRVLRDREKFRQWMRHNSGSLKTWGGLLVGAVFIFLVFSDRDFSFLLTLSSLIGMFSFAMVAFLIEKNKTCAGVSLKMIICYAFVLATRLFSIIPFQGYLPYDRTGDWLYQAIEFFSFSIACYIIYLCKFCYNATYEAENDTLNIVFLLIPPALLAFLFHPSLNAYMPADISWTYALYLEAVCCLPQLFMFQKEGKVEPFTTHFLAAQALSKVMSFFFWMSTYSELNDASKPLKSYVGVWVMVMQVLQLVIMGDFIYHYIRCLSRGVSVQFLLTENV